MSDQPPEIWRQHILPRADDVSLCLLYQTSTWLRVFADEVLRAWTRERFRILMKDPRNRSVSKLYTWREAALVVHLPMPVYLAITVVERDRFIDLFVKEHLSESLVRWLGPAQARARMGTDYVAICRAFGRLPMPEADSLVGLLVDWNLFEGMEAYHVVTSGNWMLLKRLFPRFNMPYERALELAFCSNTVGMVRYITEEAFAAQALPPPSPSVFIRTVETPELFVLFNRLWPHNISFEVDVLLSKDPELTTVAAWERLMTRTTPFPNGDKLFRIFEDTLFHGNVIAARALYDFAEPRQLLNDVDVYRTLRMADCSVWAPLCAHIEQKPGFVAPTSHAPQDRGFLQLQLDQTRFWIPTENQWRRSVAALFDPVVPLPQAEEDMLNLEDML